ncbi:MAG TPA: FAD-binding oxidoreductase [Candidatus Dormibacteraeota bacterium]|nr:FAD-binding oxidoreductase [Candidatus Dormibacteraeota bacterium]
MNWGRTPWTIDFVPEASALPATADFAVVGGGFSGLAAAAWLRRIMPGQSVVLLEASKIGSGASGRTGGLALAETAAGPLDDMGDALAGYKKILECLATGLEIDFPGVYEIGRQGGRRNSPIMWEDSGTLRVIQEVPGGGIDAGRVVSELARAASRLGVLVLEATPVEKIEFGAPIRLHTAKGVLDAGRVLLATNAQSADLSGLAEDSRAKFTLAVLTEPLPAEAIAAAGLASGKAFYTVDLPYLWGRPMPDRAVIFGSGLVDVAGDADLAALDIATGVAAGMFAGLEQRVRGFHPALATVQFVRRWGGPIRFGDSWQLFFDRHPRSPDAIVLNGLGGDGVTLSVYLGCWAAEALAGQRELPQWGKIPRRG